MLQLVVVPRVGRFCLKKISVVNFRVKFLYQKIHEVKRDLETK